MKIVGKLTLVALFSSLSFAASADAASSEVRADEVAVIACGPSLEGKSIVVTASSFSDETFRPDVSVKAQSCADALDNLANAGYVFGAPVSNLGSVVYTALLLVESAK